MNDSLAVLNEVASLAAVHGWTRVTDYIASLDETGRTILIAAAPEVDADALAAWLGGRANGARVSVAGLDALAADPAPALSASRAVIALRCGDLLMPATIAGAAAVMGRPAGSYAIVVTEAERISTEADLAAVRRVVEAGLLNQTGTGTSRDWMFWTERAVPAFLTAQVSEDIASLSRWLSSGIEQRPDLAVQQAAHALALASDADAAEADARRTAASAPSAQAERYARQLPALRASVTGLHARVLDHLDAQYESLKREVTASLETMRHDLLRAITAQAAERNPGSLAALVSERESRWTEDASRLILARQEQSARQTAGLLDVIDWAVVNEITQTPAARRYPRLIAETFSADPVMLTRAAGSAARSVPPAAAQTGSAGWSPAVRSAAVGGVVTAAAVAVLTGGIALVPIVGAAAIGVAAGTLAGAPIGPLAPRRPPATDAVQAAVSDEISRLSDTLASELADRAATVRKGADERFADLEHALAAAEKNATGPDAASADEPAPTLGAPAGEQLARLRARLAAASGRRTAAAVNTAAETPQTAADAPWAATAAQQETPADNPPA